MENVSDAQYEPDGAIAGRIAARRRLRRDALHREFSRQHRSLLRFLGTRFFPQRRPLRALAPAEKGMPWATLNFTVMRTNGRFSRRGAADDRMRRLAGDVGARENRSQGSYPFERRRRGELARHDHWLEKRSRGCPGCCYSIRHSAPKQNAAILEQDKQQILILGCIKTWRTCDDSIQCRADVPAHPTFSVTSSDNRACVHRLDFVRPSWLRKSRIRRCLRVDDSVIMRIDGKGPDVSSTIFFQVRSLSSIRSSPRRLRPKRLAAVCGCRSSIRALTGKKLADGTQRCALRLHHFQSAVCKIIGVFLSFMPF
jgi:hypothetical protein